MYSDKKQEILQLPNELFLTNETVINFAAPNASNSLNEIQAGHVATKIDCRFGKKLSQEHRQDGPGEPLRS